VRRYRELWVWLGALFLTLSAFFTAIAIAHFLKDARYSLFGNGWMLVAGLSFVAAFACFFAAATGWRPAMPRRAAFPDIRLEISAAGSVETEHETDTGLDAPAYLRSFTMRCVNAGTSQEAVLTALLYVRLVPGSWGRVGEALCPPPSWPLPPPLNLSPVSQPFALSPGEAVSGQLVFEIPRYYLDSIADPLEARLEIADQVSGKKMSAPAQIGQYDLSTLTPAEGGVAMLGPEYETPPAPRRGTDATPA
jgi:hypothetical protein